MLNTIKRKLFMLIGRALLTAVNNTGQTGFYASGTRKNPQKLSFNWFGQLTDVEQAQPYGLEAYPVVGTAKAVILSPDGSRNNAIVIMVQDETYRPTDLTEGDVCLYGKKDKDAQSHRVRLKADGSIEILSDSGTAIDLNGNTDFAVSWTDLNTALQALVTSINATFATKADAAGNAGALTLDLSTAKVTTVKLP